MKESKFDLATAIGTFVVGVIVAFMVTTFMIPAIPDETYKTIEQTISDSVDTPNSNVFNVKALNPTVEVCVGDGCGATEQQSNESNEQPQLEDWSFVNSEEDEDENGFTD
jgi:hypothetical protein